MEQRKKTLQFIIGNILYNFGNSRVTISTLSDIDIKNKVIIEIKRAEAKNILSGVENVTKCHGAVFENAIESIAYKHATGEIDLKTVSVSELNDMAAKEIEVLAREKLDGVNTTFLFGFFAPEEKSISEAAKKSLLEKHKNGQINLLELSNNDLKEGIIKEVATIGKAKIDRSIKLIEVDKYPDDIVTETKEYMLEKYKKAEVDILSKTDNELSQEMEEIINQTITIRERKTEAINRFVEFFGEGSAKYFTQAELEEAFDNVIICKTHEDFDREHGGSDAKNAAAFNRAGTIYLRPDNNVKTIVHEVNHTLGAINEFTDKENEMYRAINEAFTESIAIKLTPGSANDTAYQRNVIALNKIIDLLESKGYKDLELRSYYLNDNSFRNTVDEIAGEGFYEELAMKMDEVYQKYCEVRSKLEKQEISIEEAQTQYDEKKAALEALVTYFEECCEK